ncbi:unnamed protein product [Phyllotreta striolata]|uniref:Protoporphyrinogen oxidase n=1 Tax=Phyllotreta striolata TaxID=444603 RepID=A0A9N9TP07_PHYSR|nr:unnamed protein product [Phyllotreta striolata]
MSVAILGGGLSGLSAAYYLLKSNGKLSIRILEGSSRLGGWIRSNKLDNGVIFEEGPRTIRPRGLAGDNTLSLVQDLGLEDRITPIYAHQPAAKNRMVYAKGKLHSLPSSFGGLFKTTPPFSKPLIMYLLNDIIASSKRVEDESIYDFVNRRFGQDLADYLISPLICGICAGDSKEISVNFLMKGLFEYEQKYGSIYKGLVRNLFNVEKHELSELGVKAKREKWSVYSFKTGLETLPKTIESHVRSRGVPIELNSKCTKLQLSPNNVQIQLGNKMVAPEHLISSISSQELSRLVRDQHPVLSDLLGNIRNVTVAVINLQFGNLRLREGFGFLVPPKERLPVLGVIFDSCCFPCGDDRTVLTVMMGGAWFGRLFGDDPGEEELLSTAQKYLKVTMGVEEAPREWKVSVLRDCIPQYTVGHDGWVREIYRYIEANRLPLTLCGSSYHGVGVNDVIYSSRNAAESVCKSINAMK